MMRQIDFYDLSDYTTEARGYIDHIYLHWTAGFYTQHFGDYHLNIDSSGALWADMNTFMDKKAHTWRRNTGAIGIALDCCLGASITKEGNINYGDYPPTAQQYDMMGRVVAKLCIEIGIPLDNVYTHAEVADIDGYGLDSGDPDLRWDLYGDGDYIRNIARGYMDAWGY